MTLSLKPVTRQGGQLVLDGRPYRFAGMNVYDLAGIAERNPAELDRTLRTIAASGSNVVRFWAFPGYGTEPVGRILEANRRLGTHLRFIPVLGNQWQDMERGPDRKVKDRDWYRQGYKDTYLPHVRKLVQAYGDRPEILMWEQLNEPATTDIVGLQRFTRDVAREIKANGGRLVAISNIGTVVTGLVPSYYLPLALIPDVDVISLHDYAATYGKGRVTNGFMRAVGNLEMWAMAETAHLAGKPFFIGEVGTKITEGRPTWKPVQTPAGALAGNLAKGQHAIHRGAQGVLLWGPAPDGLSPDGVGLYLKFGQQDLNGALVRGTIARLRESFHPVGGRAPAF